jgi:cellulose synthase/poly-beta-1,6-N-acetylglucosamine synthase-like glycosyltransferase/exo-beta-1,3-glucanase (GH17 family)
VLRCSTKKEAMRKTAFAVIALVVLGNLAFWAATNRPQEERPWAGTIQGVALSPYQAHQDPTADRHPSAADVERDIGVLAGRVAGVRTYSSLNGADHVAPAARRHQMPVTAGAWLQGRPEIDEPEVAALVRQVRANPNIRRVIVGNEAILRTDVTVPEAIEYIRRVKRQVNVPVSTAEPWHVWLDHPELAAAVDYITVHILPYWEGVPVERAVDYALFRYNELRQKYPDKHILIGEIGWPSDGPWRRAAEASLVNQAKFLRQWFNVASEQRIDYYIMEAFDQPWKRTLEGSAGVNWGVWDAWRGEKFPMQGEILEVPDWPWLAALASALAVLPLLLVIAWRRDLRFGGLVFYGLIIQSAVVMLMWTVLDWMEPGLAPSTHLVWSVMVGLQLILLALLLTDGMELTEVVWSRHWRRRFHPVKATAPPHAPKVSIHVPACNEPPQMVIETLNALARLDYPNFEVLLIDNNTKDDALWKPVQAHCELLGPRFRFFHLPSWPGYKAGALNFALDNTAPDAEIVAVIDSDYQVRPDWLSSTVPYFDRAEVGFVQSPQDYREFEHDTFQRMLNWEYAGFFHIGMLQRNERNAIIQHGTMTLIRKSALQDVGRWAEWCITEDAELGLRLFEAGWEAVYMPDSFGKGLVPDSFEAYKKQRLRWAYGAVQILKKHWREFMPGRTSLTAGQKYQFVAGWMPWFADAAHMVFAAAGILWSLLLLLQPISIALAEVYGRAWVNSIGLGPFAQQFEFPPTAFMIPMMFAFGFKVAASFWLYAARVPCGWRERLGAAIAGMALTHTVGRAVWQGLFTSGRPFHRTPKCEDKPAFVQGLMGAREEGLLLLGLWTAAALLYLGYGNENRDAFLWIALLLVQSLPYLAALVTSMINAIPALRTAPAREVPAGTPVQAAE